MNLAEDSRFIFIDTSENEIARINDAFFARLDGQKLINENERVDLGPTNPKQLFVHAKEQEKNDTASRPQSHLLSFVDDRGTNSWRNEPLRFGAGGNRQLGRVGIWNSIGAIQAKVASAIQGLNTIAGGELRANLLPIYLFSGTCGGTGSSSFLDVAYILDQEFKTITGSPESTIRAMLFMPNWYIQYYRRTAGDRIVENYQDNSYAFFEEIKYFLKDKYRPSPMPGQKFSAVSVVADPLRGVTDVNREWRVFNFAVCIDDMSESGRTFTLDQMYQNAAELIFHWSQGNTAGTMVAELDNVLTESYANVSEAEPIPAFATMGYRALQFPEDLMSEYFRRRFFLELFQDGIYGDQYEDALPEKERKKEVSQIFRNCIAGYIAESEKVDLELPNLEQDRQQIIGSFMAGLTNTRFRRAGRIQKAMGKSDADADYDADMIGDERELRHLKDNAEAIIAAIRKEMDDRFRGDGLSSRNKLIKLMRSGNEDLERRAVGSIESSLENAVLRFGLRYAVGLTGEIETQIDIAIAEFREQKDALVEQLKRLDAEIEEATLASLSGGSKDRKKGFAALFGQLQDKIRANAQLLIKEQQIRLLNDLSEGEIGILDEYRHNLKRLTDLVNKELSGVVEGSSPVIGLRDNFHVELPRRFLETSEDVTTTYIPEIRSFATDVGWTTDHLFSTLYSTLVPQERRAGGGEKPKRYGGDFGRERSKAEGLHRIIYDLLTDRVTTGKEGGWDVDGELQFFRRCLSGDSQDLLNELKEYAEKYINQMMDSSDAIRKEINRPLPERYKRLSAEERRRLQDLFSDAGTQTFCSMPLASNQKFRSLFVGSSEEFAKELGFVPGGLSQFLAGDSANRFVRIKLATEHKVDNYVHFGSYRDIYLATKEERKNDGTVFAPHLHKLFNEHGVEDGMRLLLDRESLNPMKIFALSLLYNEMFQNAQQNSPAALDEIIYLDSVLTGDRRTLYQPLLLEDIQGSSEKTAWLPNRVDFFEGKLLLSRGNYTNVGAVKRYKNVYDLIENRDYILSALHIIDTTFRDRCSVAWVGTLDSSANSLIEKIKKLSVDAGSAGSFYNELSNSIHTLRAPLKVLISNKQTSSPSSTNDEEDNKTDW